MLGEFECFILSAATRLREGADGAAIRQEIEDATRRGCSIGALYTTLDRLGTKGLIKTWIRLITDLGPRGSAELLRTQTHAGRPRRFLAREEVNAK